MVHLGQELSLFTLDAAASSINPLRKKGALAAGTKYTFAPHLVACTPRPVRFLFTPQQGQINQDWLLPTAVVAIAFQLELALKDADSRQQVQLNQC